MAMCIPQQAIKFSPLHLVNFYPTLEFSFEQKIATRVTVQLEVGYVLDYKDIGREDFENKRGVKLKTESRYYFFGRADKRKAYYLAGELYTNIINFDRELTTQECFDVGCEHMFTRTDEYKMEYREKGFTIKAGMLKRWGKFLFDLSSGFTVRDIEYREPSNLVEQFNDDWAFFQIPNETDRIALSPNFGIRFGYTIR